jgi:hypothetical protein
MFIMSAAMPVAIFVFSVGADGERVQRLNSITGFFYWS